MNHLEQNKQVTEQFRSKPYQSLTRFMVVIYLLFMAVYLFRDSLYKLQNPFVTLFAGTVPNLIPSFLFVLVGVFYAAPLFFSGGDMYKKPVFIVSINALNVAAFSLIEYLHVVFQAGVWDNNDILASVLGGLVATIVYYKIRKTLLVNKQSL